MNSYHSFPPDVLDRLSQKYNTSAFKSAFDEAISNTRYDPYDLLAAVRAEAARRSAHKAGGFSPYMMYGLVALSLWLLAATLFIVWSSGDTQNKVSAIGTRVSSFRTLVDNQMTSMNRTVLALVPTATATSTPTVTPSPVPPTDTPIPSNTPVPPTFTPVATPTQEGNPPPLPTASPTKTGNQPSPTPRKLTTTSRPSHLYGVSGFTDGEETQIVVRQLPEGTPVELVGENTGGHQEVYVLIWVQADKLDLVGEKIIANSGEVWVGETPDDRLNAQNVKRELSVKAEGYPFEKIADGGTIIRIKLRGWMLANSLNSVP